MKFFPGLLLVAVFLASCEGGGPERPPLPEGIQTFSGVLLPTELSLVRRGTHVLMQGEKELYFVESTVVTLRNYERKMVTLRGTLEPNVDSKLLPVFVVDSIVDIESTTRDWGIRQLDLSLTTPLSWQQRNEGGQVQFFAEGMERPVLTIDEGPAPGETSLGESLVVDGFPGVRIVNEQNGNQAVYVLREEMMVTFLFTPRDYPNPEKLREEWVSVLASVQFLSRAESSEAVTGTGAVGPAKPCGGPAGVLCPAGFFCEVTDMETDSGTCQPLH
ncbi:hypothetical protein A2454_06810 [Candidatus Peribacteria bacterium RIFOXYC2_FULL_55_14]|nr:MAG: hypothetical protein UY85_C0049G0004 [Candidatus Peribacteria bacterium GW2011_GWB1_54_5]KKW40232.1 MAG: hypothetical protein UY87_C0026G0025 [Candidatus Peribacteria bacterium GW2011_GWC2_54_8]OGJ72101.1 MAG: hypothetical protein A2198_04500 [Candidatus Peribacteria bacterium RIFOXYA1_FULL_56_14]OGJ74115.1 MAG: hypothetical protein A2217_00520 [Candidatus Peribacteria bacterium RIFOXYA2_FULL_55_28]OGJ75546.1 MAG: hypothetical protein A2384_01480 [Candidatus Peribacteria bacterium RIFOX